MKIVLLVIGETHKKWAAEGEKEYMSRLRHYVDFEKVVIPDLKGLKNLSIEQIKEKEGEQILARLSPGDAVILLDEKGEEFTSVKFSAALQRLMNGGQKRAVFVVGGPYGFSETVYSKASRLLSFSRLTFPHDLIRVIFAEQLYRAFSILRNEPYHHD